MPLSIAGQVGPQVLGDGVPGIPRLDRQGGLIASELHGRYYEQTFRGNVYSAGTGLISINNATFTTATLGATCTPIIGIWNPLTNTVNLVILQAILGIVITALQNTGGGPFAWAVSGNNNNLTLGSVPVNRKTLSSGGSSARTFSGVALTGLSNNLTVAHGSALGGGNAFNIATLDTAAGFSTIYTPTYEDISGSIIVPPGAIFALLATTTPVAQSALASLLWEEVAI